MDNTKAELFHRENPGRAFPKSELLSASAAMEIRNMLTARMGLRSDVDSLVLAYELDGRESTVKLAGVNAASPRFNLLMVLEQLSIASHEYVYINWNAFQVVDRMKIFELSKYFAHIWYPGPDEIDIFDASCDWILSVDADGGVSYVIFR